MLRLIILLLAFGVLDILLPTRTARRWPATPVPYDD